MKKLKRILAVLMTMAMVLGMTVTAFAAEETSTTEATVIGVEKEEGKNITVEAYQIIRYNPNGYYEEVIKDSITKDADENLAPSADDVQKLYNTQLSKLGTPTGFEGPNADGNYTSSTLGVGTWLVVVKGSEKYLYNPAIISVQQGTDGKVYGTLNLVTDTWGDDVYLKKDEPTITKKAESAGSDTTIEGTQYGDILKFTVTADIPSYTPGKTEIQYKISDTLTGLTLVNDDAHKPSATVGGENNTELTNAVENSIKNGETSFVVNDPDKPENTHLTNKFLTDYAGKQIVITYFAQVTSTELINVDKLNNTASLDYSTNDQVQHKSADTKHYTFGIDTVVDGVCETSTFNKTGEFIKINDKGDVQYEEHTGAVTKTTTEVEYLDGAEFQLHIGKADGPLFTDKQGKDTFTTADNGRLQIVGLDDTVEYYLVETKAPTGYTLNNTPIKVTINATYAEDGTLESYSVSMDGNESTAVTNYRYDETEGKTTLLNAGEASNPFGFKNTKLAELPSTGGIGTYIFTIAGILIMAAAAGFFFVSRRKAEK